MLLAGTWLLSGCNSGSNTAEQSKETTIPPSEKELLTRAQEIFAPLPASASSEQNPVTSEKVALGKVLYYDTRLSKTGNNSCNSCHNLATYGVDNKATSQGDNGGFGDRNSPTTLNAALHSMQFWDGRAKDVEEQAGMPILNPAEMAIPSKEFLVKRLEGIAEYQEMFKAAFPADKQPISYNNIQNAIAAFERTLLTPSPFDKYLGGDYAALTEEQRTGLKTFIDVGCTQCHNGAIMGGTSLQKFGVHADYRPLCNSKTNDEGRKKVTNMETDKDMFKVPSLRNIEKTHPYFHDGSVADLAQAVKIMGKVQLNKDLSDAQVASIVAFMKALTGEVPKDAQEKPAILAQK